MTEQHWVDDNQCRTVREDGKNSYLYEVSGLLLAVAMTAVTFMSGGCAALNRDNAADGTRNRPPVAGERNQLVPQCDGIELMGLDKNEIFGTATGVVRIRNNTAVTRTVVLGWRDSSGQQRFDEVLIPAGATASPRIGMMDSRQGLPVSGYRVVSCE